MQHRFTGPNPQENFENVEKLYKPHLSNHNLKPPKPTNANLLRTRENFKSLREAHSPRIKSKIRKSPNRPKSALPLNKDNLSSLGAENGSASQI